MLLNIFRPYMFTGLHILAWVLLGYIQLFYIPLTWNIMLPDIFWIWQTIVLFFMIVIFYYNAKIIVPKTIIKDKIGPFLLLVLLVIFLMQLIAFFYNYNTDLRNKLALILGFKKYRSNFFDNYVFTLTLLVLGISTSWAMLQHWQKAAQHKQKLEQDKTMAELSMLKAQINPHFFFNSLNSIYSLTYSNIEDSRNALHTLSSMMRYLLYSTEGERTTLLKEVEFLKNFIALMRLRTNSKLTIVTDIPEKLHDFPIVPMLFLPLVENAFKHGVNATDKSEIIIIIRQTGNDIELEVENTYFEKTNIPSSEGGIGLTNTKRRLQLIYPDKHVINAGITENGKYKINLQITLEQ
ncbi:histidine kinase [Flavobacterium sp. Fl-77]|uniref:Histidine kinase n=1 Tax=Flavobacterium flavipigmentatum TaxID=2893884 RepID=A0AAJ2SIP9_9FLAO|nr:MULTISPECIES: histidine kinase [unclassified Flavobacterium]MDX6183634.1 histidine kinase [Flavobacterium sp. Fl-33]MDX6187186.1 histidine kinase [Flavobacterium sp. Fl-77]UFH38003.1 histidine kinase [Flavobacterium sp. F-70]